MLLFDQVSKFKVSDVSFHVPEGCIVGLIGYSGAGKTTLIKLACGLLAPERGQVWTLGQDALSGRGRQGRRIGVCMADVGQLDGDNTVEEEFMLLGKTYHMPVSQFRQEYKELSARLGFAEYEKQKCKMLSLGQSMRVRFAMTLMNQPELILLDEPAIGMDEQAKGILEELLKERAAKGTAVLITSHDMPEVERLCERIALLREGRLVYYGSRKNFRYRFAPWEEMTLELSGRIPDLEYLPVCSYSLQGNRLSLRYRSDEIGASEMISCLLGQTEILGICVRKKSLEDMIKDAAASPADDNAAD